MKKYIILALIAAGFPTLAIAQNDMMDHSMHNGQIMTKSADEKFVDPEDKNFPADYHEINTTPEVGEPIKKTVNDGQVLHGPDEIPGGEFIIQGIDPQGAMFALVGTRK